MPKRSLMLAGGGVKVAFQAGVLQVWLDEAGVAFDHADAVSAACFNLAMWVQGMSGTEIADNWRNTPPLSEVDVNGPPLARLLYAASLLDLEQFRRKISPAWNLDWSKIRSSSSAAVRSSPQVGLSRRLSDELIEPSGARGKASISLQKNRKPCQCDQI